MGYRTVNEEMGKPFMRKFILFLLAMGMFGFCGCARRTELVKDSNLPEITKDEYSTVYMFRESRAFGFSKAYPIQINGKYLFRIGNGDCVTFKIPTGQSEIVFVPRIKRVKFMSEKGGMYYFYVQAEAGESGSEFRQITEEEWKGKEKACNWVRLK